MLVLDQSSHSGLGVKDMVFNATFNDISAI